MSDHVWTIALVLNSLMHDPIFVHFHVESVVLFSHFEVFSDLSPILECFFKWKCRRGGTEPLTLTSNHTTCCVTDLLMKFISKK